MIPSSELVIGGEEHGSQIESPIPALQGQTHGLPCGSLIRSDIAHQKGTDALLQPKLNLQP